MSLKSFHIVFISLSVATALFFGAWILLTEDAGGMVFRIIGGTASFVVGIALALYGRYFLRRFKHFSFM